MDLRLARLDYPEPVETDDHRGAIVTATKTLWVAFAAVWIISLITKIFLPWPMLVLPTMAAGLTVWLSTGFRWLVGGSLIAGTVLFTVVTVNVAPWTSPLRSTMSVIGDGACFPSDCIMDALDDPQAYFAAHRVQFDEIARLAQAGALPGIDEYDGAELPAELAEVSVTGSAGWVGALNFPTLAVRPGKILFVPAWTGIPDDAGGFLYAESEPDANAQYDLYGRPGHFQDAEHLDGSWWILL